jgi:TonB family protein
MSKTLLAILLTFAFSTPSIAQKKEKKERAKPDSAAYYMRNDHDLAYSESDARFLRLIIRADSGMFNIQDYYMDAKPRLVARSYNDDVDFRTGTQGLCTQYFANGNKKQEAYFNKGLLVGDGIEYYPNGTVYNIKNYDNPKSLFLKKCLDSTGNVLADNGNGTWVQFDDRFERNVLKGSIVNGKEDGKWEKYANDGSVYTIIYKNGMVISGQEFTGNMDKIFNAVEQAPSFPGGDAALARYLGRNIKYPTVARDKNIKGQVVLTFVIEKDGTLTELKILRSPHESLSNEAIRVMAKCPVWKPGIQNGNPVRVQYSMPINFALQDESAPTNNGPSRRSF